jgi:hypothetical protein
MNLNGSKNPFTRRLIQWQGQRSHFEEPTCTPEEISKNDPGPVPTTLSISKDPIVFLRQQPASVKAVLIRPNSKSQYSLPTAMSVPKCPPGFCSIYSHPAPLYVDHFSRKALDQANEILKRSVLPGEYCI